DQLAHKQKRADELVVRSPIAGKLMAPEIRHWVGKYIKESEEVGLVYQPGDLPTVACFDQTDAALTYNSDIIKPGNQAEVQPAGLLQYEPGKILHAKVEPFNPTPQYELPHPALGYHGGGPTETDPS